LAALQKYGVRPLHSGETVAESETPAGAASAPSGGGTSPSASSSNTTASAKAAATRDRDQDDTDDAPKPATVKPGTTGPMQFLKGKIVSSDCSKPPEATVTVLSGMTTYKMHASDYKSLLVIGEDQFSCDWKNRLVSINYRAAGKNAGELVSVELR
jgi:hypothetical protein